MKKQIRLMSAALAACTLLTAGGAPAFAAEGAKEHNYTILREITDDTDFMWFPEGETMRFEQDGKYGLKSWTTRSCSRLCTAISISPLLPKRTI